MHINSLQSHGFYFKKTYCDLKSFTVWLEGPKLAGVAGKLYNAPGDGPLCQSGAGFIKSPVNAILSGDSRKHNSI